MSQLGSRGACCEQIAPNLREEKSSVGVRRVHSHGLAIHPCWLFGLNPTLAAKDRARDKKNREECGEGLALLDGKPLFIFPAAEKILEELRRSVPTSSAHRSCGAQARQFKSTVRIRSRSFITALREPLMSHP